MHKPVIAAATGLMVVVTASLTVPRAEAMPLAPPAGITDQLDIIDQVALCFYVDGWNGPGMYQCGYRHRQGYGWHGAREERREFRRDERDFRRDERHFRREDRRDER
jgi:hypothetical protein